MAGLVELKHIESIRIVTASELTNLSVLQFYHLYSYYSRILTAYPHPDC